MPRDARLPVRPLVFAALAAFLATLAAPARGAAGVTSDKIDPWLQAHAAAGQAVEFIVVLADQADLSPARGLPERSAKARFVREALWTKARSTQPPLLAWLEAQGAAYRPFYIVNAVLVTAPLAVAEAAAARPDVARIEGNPRIAAVRPVEPAPAELESASRAALEPQAIEPGLVSIRAPEVWALGATGQGIVIGGADTGVDWEHPALKGKYRGWDGVTASHDYNWHDSVHSEGGVCGYDSPEPCDDHGHGTHTIGIAVGGDSSGTNQIGVAPGATFIACRNMDQGAGTPARYLECMEWFLAPYPVGGTPAEGDPARAPDVTTNSWGCPASEGCAPGTLQAAVEAQRAAGILFVAAAGNSGSSCSSVSEPPAHYDASYTVGAYSSSTAEIASFSSRGPVTVDGSGRTKPDIAAPGVAVRSAYPGGGYVAMSGTSMAAPHVAGAVALLWSMYPALRHLVAPTEDLLNQGAVEVGSTLCSSTGVPDNLYGWGRLDVRAAADLGPLAVGPGEPAVPGAAGISLAPALPNPARRSTLLRLALEREGEIDLAILSSSGRRVRTLAQGLRPAGQHAVRWDGRDGRGAVASPGVYLVRLRVRGEVAACKLIWLGP